MKQGTESSKTPQAEPLSEADKILFEKGRRWFAEARAQTARDDAEVAAWNHRRSNGGNDGDAGGSTGFGDGDGGCGGD